MKTINFEIKTGDILNTICNCNLYSYDKLSKYRQVKSFEYFESQTKFLICKCYSVNYLLENNRIYEVFVLNTKKNLTVVIPYDHNVFEKLNE